MSYVREPVPHSHPCGICTRLGACSCSYPAVSTDFICDGCHYARAVEAGAAPLEHHPWLNQEDVQTLLNALVTLRRDQTGRSLADRLQAVLEKVVAS